jgi:outer membrane protein insertion porin family
MIDKRSTKRKHPSTLLMWFLIIAASYASASENQGKIRPWLVKAVYFYGNTSLSASELLGEMDTKPSRLFHKIKFSLSILTTDIETIASLYRDRGFLGIQVKADDIIKDPSSRRVTVNIVISEGPQTCIEKVAIQGGIVFGEAGTKRFIQAKPLAPYSMVKLTFDQQTICDSMAARGYPLCAVERLDSVDSTKHTASIVFIIDQGPLSVAGPLTINGAKRLRRIIIKRGLTFHQGDTLTAGRIQLSMRQLYETGMFKYVRIETPIADSAQKRLMTGPISQPVFIDIEEADFYKIQGGIGYGTYEGPRLSLSTSYGNVRGLGRIIGLEGKYSRLIQSVHLHYTAPWFLLLPPTAEAEVYGEHHNEVTFTGYLEGLTLSIFAKTQWAFSYRVFTSFEWVNNAEAQLHAPTFALMIHDNNTQSFGVGISYDNRDYILDPLKGLLIAADAELAGLVGKKTNHFYKFIVDVRGYVPIRHDLSAASGATAGYVNGYDIDKASVPSSGIVLCRQ